MSEGSFPLIPVQEEILFQTLRQPLGAGVYLTHLVLRIGERIEVPLLGESCRRVVARHGPLRTGFDWTGGEEVLQVVQREVELPFISEDWRSVPEKEQKGRLRGFLIADRFNGFDLRTPPLIRAALIRLGQSEYRLIWTYHRIILDNPSARTVAEEVRECYRSLAEGRPWEPPPAPDFGAFARWLRERRGPAQDSFWKAYLKGFTSPTPVPPPLVQKPAGAAEKRREPGDTITARQERRVLDPDLLAGLRSLAGAAGCDLRTLLWGAWAVMLGRHSGRDEVLFAITDSLRHLAPPGLNGVGNYSATVPLRASLPPRSTLGPWLAGLAADREAMRGSEDAALSRIRSQSPLSGGEPLFETYLDFEEEPLRGVPDKARGDWAGLEMSLETRTPVPLLLSAGLSRELTLELEYDRRRYGGEAAARMIGQVETILRGMVANPAARLAELPVLTRDEVGRLFSGWQPPPPPDLPEERVHRIFSAVAAAHPGAPAVRQGGESLTYAQLEERANRWARLLQARGVGPERLVGLCLERSPAQIVLLLAILKAGGAYLPLDPDYPLDRLEYMIADSGLELVVASGPAAAGSGLESVLEAGRLLIVEEQEEVLAGLAPAPPPCGTDGQSLAYLIYTSGSTGQPKGVMVEHRALANHILTSCSPYNIRPGESCLQFASISFDAATEEIFVALLNGATLVLRTEEMIASIPAFVSACAQQGLKVLGLPTAFWHLLAEELEPGGLPPGIRLVVIGGEAARPERLALWQSKVDPGVCLLNCYGPTEATIGATLAELSQERIGEQVAIGRPVGGLRAYVLDRELRPVPQGAPGELFLAGPQLARGYLGRPELTRERFPTLNPIPPEYRGAELDPGELRLYRTGDRVRHRLDGNLLYLDRYDRQVQIRGFRVELGEVEAFLSDQPGVSTALVDTREDGSGEKTLIGYILPREKGREEALRERLERRLAAGLPAHMRPSALVFIEAVPLNNSGKVDHRALPDPAPAREAGPGPAPRPLSPTEAALVSLWEEVLGVRGIGPGDNFFDLGGHSLLAVKLISRIEKNLGQSLHPLRLFQSPTVAGLARHLEREGEGPAGPEPRCLEVYRAEGRKPPLFFVGSVLLAPALGPHLGPDQPFYGLNIFGLQEEGGRLGQESIGEIAARYIEEIRTVRAKGPYRLAGYCADGDVALEMALQLREAGEEVDFLAYVDSFWAEGAALGLSRHRANLGRYGWAYVRSKVRQKQRVIAARLGGIFARAEGRVRRGLGLAVPSRVATSLFIEAWFAALHAYQIPPYPGLLTIILASEWSGRLSPEAERIGAGGVRMVETPGFHDNLFEEPQAAELGRVLRGLLEEAGG